MQILNFCLTKNTHRATIWETLKFVVSKLTGPNLVNLDTTNRKISRLVFVKSILLYIIYIYSLPKYNIRNSTRIRIFKMVSIGNIGGVIPQYGFVWIYVQKLHLASSKIDCGALIFPRRKNHAANQLVDLLRTCSREVQSPPHLDRILIGEVPLVALLAWQQYLRRRNYIGWRLVKSNSQSSTYLSSKPRHTASNFGLSTWRKRWDCDNQHSRVNAHRNTFANRISDSI